MKFDLIPHSRATNSYELLMDVVDALRAEPKRFSWGNWVRNTEFATDLDGDKFPACGTQGCLHGWVKLLTIQNLNELDQDSDSQVYINKWFPAELTGVMDALAYGRPPYTGKRPQDYVAYVIYNVTKFQMTDPTDHCPYTDWMNDPDLHKFKWETQEQYAERGIRALRAFASEHFDALNAFQIVIPPRNPTPREPHTYISPSTDGY